MSYSPESPNSQAAIEADSFDYRLLKGHYRTDGSWKTDEQLRMEYLQRTDELIERITAGVEVENPQTGEMETQAFDTVVFLDKSARPVSWLMKEAWDIMATDETGEVVPMPDIRYLNIDREQWINTVDPEGRGSMEIDKVDQGAIRSLRSIFIDPKNKRDGLTEAIDNTPTQLDGANVLVVDEVFSSGRTLTIARRLIQRAFPSARVEGDYWMKGIASKSSKGGGMAFGNADLPVWYKEDTVYGRGVGNRDRDPTDSQSPNLTQKLGRWFLSTRLPEVDDASKQLRTELKQLVEDPEVPKRPSKFRDDYEERVERYNQQPFEDIQSKIMQIANDKPRR